MGDEIKGLGSDGLQGQQPSAQGNTLGISNRQMRNGGCKVKVRPKDLFYP